MPTNVELERRQSGVWSVVYQPDIDDSVKLHYQDMFLKLQEILNPTKYNTMARKPMACFEAVIAFAKPLNTILNYDGFNVFAGTWLQCQTPIPIRFGPPQTGQEVLEIQKRGDGNNRFAVVDIAAYLFDFPYSEIPIAVGNQQLIERTMSEIYSQHTGKQLTVTLMRRKCL